MILIRKKEFQSNTEQNIVEGLTFVIHPFHLMLQFPREQSKGVNKHYALSRIFVIFTEKNIHLQIFVHIVC